MAPNTSLNGDNCVKIFRAVQFLVCLIALGLVGENISAWHGHDCNTPGKLGFNAACAGLTLPVLLYLLLSTGAHRLSFLPWNQYIQLFVDSFFFILWIAAAGASNISCSDMCSACSNKSILDNCGLCPASSRKRDVASPMEKRAVSSSTKLGNAIGKMIAKQGVDATMVILFFLTLVGTTHGIYTQRKALRGHGPVAATPTSRTTDVNTAYEPMSHQQFEGQQKFKPEAHVEETAMDNSPPAAPYQYMPPQQPVSAYAGGYGRDDDHAPLMTQGQPSGYFQSYPH